PDTATPRSWPPGTADGGTADGGRSSGLQHPSGSCSGRASPGWPSGFRVCRPSDLLAFWSASPAKRVPPAARTRDRVVLGRGVLVAEVGRCPGLGLRLGPRVGLLFGLRLVIIVQPADVGLIARAEGAPRAELVPDVFELDLLRCLALLALMRDRAGPEVRAPRTTGGLLVGGRLALHLDAVELLQHPQARLVGVDLHVPHSLRRRARADGRGSTGRGSTGRGPKEADRRIRQEQPSAEESR